MPRTKTTKLEWDRMLQFFISRISYTYRDVAEEFNANLSTVTNHAVEHNWQEFKNTYYQSHRDLDKLVEQELDIQYTFIKASIYQQEPLLRKAMRDGDEEAVNSINAKIQNAFKIVQQIQAQEKQLKALKDKKSNMLYDNCLSWAKRNKDKE